jgi:histidine triad (HIT) family protein
MSCPFCDIAAGSLSAAMVLDEPEVLAFLDRSPVFSGHVLIVPRTHYETLTDLPADLLPLVFGAAQRIAKAVQQALGVDGTWVSMNNTVSQSVPHLHVHVVPRKRKDGLRGFYWPRVKYPSDEAMHEVAALLRSALSEATVDL